jgi:C2 domain
MGCNESIDHKQPVKSSSAKEDGDIHNAVKMALGKIFYEEPSSQIEIHFSCADLPDTDILSKTDPFIVFYLKNSQTNNWEIVGYTEVISNTLNPKFVKSITTKYLFEEKQFAKIDIYDQDNENYKQLDKQEYIGSAEFTIGDLVKEKQSGITLEIKGKFKKGKVHLFAEQSTISNTNLSIEVTIESTSTQSMVIISKQKDCIQLNAEWIPIYKTEVIVPSKCNHFNTISVPFIDDTRPLLFEIFE